ncbi:CD82 antigen isoform X1 [Cryptotermes secundus]|uniref:CD82 antigen isoform X1 n=1 Tax=Cryptotermes secundus TaxID=105785 RepID=UPI000CD7DE8C|nr:CD82 antigen isoform X1 [Cryptotermes secundus]
MAIGCGLKCSKGVLLTFNLLFWLSGGVFLVVGIWIILDPTKTHLFHLTYTEDVAADLLQYLGYCLVAIGCVIFLVGFCGCCGSLYERRSVLITYFVFLFLLLCAELSVAVATLIYREDFLTGLENRLLNRFRNLYGRDSSVFTQAIDQAQYTFNCCGILSDADYVNTKWRNESVGISNRSRINVPLTCCTLANPDVSNAGSPIIVVSRFFTGTVEESWQHPQPKDETACQDTEVNKNQMARHKKGCLEDLEKWFKEDTTLLIGLGIGIAFFHMIGMILSIGLCRNIGDGLAQGH